MHQSREVPTQSREAARACLLARHSETEIAALLITSEFLHRVPAFLRELIEGVEWLRDTRARLTGVDDPPGSVLTAIALGELTDEDSARVAEMSDGKAMFDQINAALKLAESVRRARQLLPQTAMFGRREAAPGKLKALARMPVVDLLAGLLLSTEQAGFSPKFTATEAMAFAVLAGVEPLTDDPTQRLNTWSKRLLRMAKYVRPWIVDLSKVHLQIVARRVTKLAEIHTVHERVRSAIDAAAGRTARVVVECDETRRPAPPSGGVPAGRSPEPGSAVP